MNKSYPYVEIQKLLEPAKGILILIPSLPTFDQVACALSLYLSLVKNGQPTSILSPDEMIVEFSHLVGVDKIGTKLPGGELVVTVDAPLENVEKVTSTEEGGRLNLTIRPKPGTPPFTKENILLSEKGAAGDLLFVIEARKLDSLGKIYQENSQLFKDKPVVQVSHYPKAESFGQVSVVDPAASCSSEIMVSLLQGLNLPVDADISSNLLLGLKQATQNFQSPAVTAETFEAAAFCLRHGVVNSQVPLKDEGKVATPVSTPSPDWFEPKIYKGSTLP